MPLRNQEIANLRKEMTRETRWHQYFVDYVDPSDCADDRSTEAYARQPDSRSTLTGSVKRQELLPV